MIDYKNIAIGFINATKHTFGVSNDAIEAKAADRYEICLQCPLISETKSSCTKCGCSLYLKTRSGSNCPDNKW